MVPIISDFTISLIKKMLENYNTKYFMDYWSLHKMKSHIKI